MSSGGAGVDVKQPKAGLPYAIIMEPSRELAEQTLVQVQKFKKHLTGINIREVLLVGGVAAKEQVWDVFILDQRLVMYQHLQMTFIPGMRYVAT